MPGLVKIGKTTWLPSKLADESSGFTGVAIPFVVVYEDCFGDCDAAKSFVHTKLVASGLRLSDNREVFWASVSDVVKNFTFVLDSGNRAPAMPQLPAEILVPSVPECYSFGPTGYFAA